MKKLATVMAFLALALPVRAIGLRTQFGEVVVKNIKIGQTYSMSRLLNLPLRVINTGDREIDIKIEAMKVNPDERRPNYEPLGSLDWVRVVQSTFTVASNREAVTDLIINLPNDPALLGRRFEADFLTRTTSNRGAYAVALVSRLMIHVDSTPPSEEELKNKYVDENVANLDFTVFPVNGGVADVALGRAVSLRKEHKLSIKLINPNETAVSFRVRSIPSWESEIQPVDGYEDPPDSKWLTPEKDVVQIAANSIGDTSLTLTVPDEEWHRGKKYFFVVSFEILEQKIPTRVFYRLLVGTESAKKIEAKSGNGEVK